MLNLGTFLIHSVNRYLQRIPSLGTTGLLSPVAERMPPLPDIFPPSSDLNCNFTSLGHPCQHGCHLQALSTTSPQFALSGPLPQAPVCIYLTAVSLLPEYKPLPPKQGDISRSPLPPWCCWHIRGSGNSYMMMNEAMTTY